MGVQSKNLVLGPARIYWAPYGSAEPADASVTDDGFLTPPGAPWTDFGGTDGGVNLEIDSTYTALTVDQVLIDAGARLTGLKMSVTAGLAEISDENLQVSLNNIAESGEGEGYLTLDIPDGVTVTQPQYSALCVDGWGPETATGAPALRRAIVRKVLSETKVTLTSDRKTQQKLACTFNTYFVGAGVKPVHIVTATQ
jgi:hypothetical protein